MTAVPRANGVPEFAAARDMYEAMEAATRDLPADACVRNFAGVVLSVAGESATVETELFPREALEFYTYHNMGDAAGLGPAERARLEALREKYYTPARGGGQGDYSGGMSAKVDNVADCLGRFPGSKRGVLTMPYSSGLGSHEVRHGDTDEAKCLRELHLYVDGADGLVHATGFMRAQAASIFPKNIHLVGALVSAVAGRCGRGVGSYTHVVTTLVNGR